MSYEIATIVDWKEKLARIAKKAHFRPVFVLWTDCNKACPAIREAAKAEGVHLLEVSVGSAEDYKDPEFFLRKAPEYQPLKGGIPRLAAYTHSLKLKAQSGPEIEKAGSHEAALEAATAFFRAHKLQTYPNPLACPHVQTGIAIGVAVLAVVGAAVYLSQRNKH